MNKYYYLVASIPYIKFGDIPPYTKDKFIEEGRKWLSPEDMKRLLSADLENPEIAPEDIELLKDWKRFDMFLREGLARARAARKNNDGYKVSDELKNIIEQPNPLLMEMALEETRWDYIEGKSVIYQFDVNWLVLWFLQLQILERIQRFNKDKGEKFFYETCEVKYEQ